MDVVPPWWNTLFVSFVLWSHTSTHCNAIIWINIGIFTNHEDSEQTPAHPGSVQFVHSFTDSLTHFKMFNTKGA